MSTVDLLINLKFKTEISAFKAEILLDESHEYSAQITDYPVEDGATINDHAIKQPERVTMNFLVSDTPIIIGGGGGGAIASLLGVTESQKAYDYLKDLWKNGEIFTLICKYDVFLDMAIESMTPTRNSKTGQALNFAVTFKKFNLVNAANVETSAEKATPPAKPRQQGAADKGKQTTQAAGETTSSQTSVLKGAFGS